jgi:subtilisin-like proprotein convertase family protein
VETAEENVVNDNLPAVDPLTPDQYQVYHIPVESPSHSSPPTPADGRTTEVNPADSLASPYGWHDTNGAAGAEYTTTQGNNVHAYTDTNADNLPDAGSSPDGGPTLNFSFALNLNNAPSTYRPAAVTNLFHWNNLMHDLWYQYGFDEASGNFQVNNYGRGGLGNDYVQAEAQDGVGFNNANFGTPADGSRPRMQMFLWNAPNPDRDGDLDNGIIAHEYGHGVSNRLTGGPSNVNCLGNAEQMGEGWSDWLGIMMTIEVGDAGTDPRGVGTYALNQPSTGTGIRSYPYSTSMVTDPRTYDTIKTAAIPHGVGSTWAAMLWEVSWALINDYGFDPDIYNGTGGNNIAMQLVIDGMKLQPCSPGFVDGRNAILQADLNNYGGAHQCLIWTAFAKRGLGFSASQGSSSSVADGTQAFDVPASCNLLDDGTPQTQTICSTVANVAEYSVWVGGNFTAPVTMSASGYPAGSTPTFSPNPVSPVKRLSFLDLAVPMGAASGDYTITMTGNGVATDNETVGLTVYDSVPGAATLTTPADGATGVSLTPNLTWSAASEAVTYGVQIATDPAFANVVDSASGFVTTNYTPGAELGQDTVYYWRVRANNPCGDSTWSAAFAFRTGATQTTMTCRNGLTVNIPDNNTTGVNDDMVNPGSGVISDLNIVITATHTWVGDARFTLSHVDTGTVVAVLDRPGVPGSTWGCDQNHVGATFNDEASLPAENQCAASNVVNPPPYAIAGSLIANNALTAFDGQSYAGTWRLNASDWVGGDTGQLRGWCLQATSPAISSDRDYSDLAAGYGVAWHEGSGALRLGTLWTPDSSFTQDSDDSDDGVTRTGGTWTAGSSVGLNVTVNGGDGNDFLACWFDWDNDGLLENPAEKSVAQMVNNGANNINFSVPAGFDPATDSVLDSRCRLYEAEPMGIESTETPDGGTVEGEVEDYRWGFSPTAVTLRQAQLGLTSNAARLVVGLLAVMILSLAAVVTHRRLS